MSESQPTKRSCLCRLCLRDRQIAMVRNYGNSAAKIRLIDELHEILESAEFDNDYWEAVESGKWPASRQIAERIIRKCNALEQIAG